MRIENVFVFTQLDIRDGARIDDLMISDIGLNAPLLNSLDRVEFDYGGDRVVLYEKNRINLFSESKKKELTKTIMSALRS
jgi:hypothetical protein